MSERAATPTPVFHVEQWSPYEGRWTVAGVADETEAGVSNANRYAQVPLGGTLVQRHIRLHEAHHALHSPPDPSASSHLRRMIEELRVNALAYDAGVDVHLQHETCYRHWSLPIPTASHDQVAWWLQFAASTWAHESLTLGLFGPEHEHPDISPAHRTWLRALEQAMSPAVRALAAEAGRRVLAEPGSLLAADNTAAWLERELRERHGSTAELPSERARAYCSCDYHRERDCPHYDSSRTRQRKPLYACRKERHRDDDPDCPVHHPLTEATVRQFFAQDAQQQEQEQGQGQERERDAQKGQGAQGGQEGGQEPRRGPSGGAAPPAPSSSTPKPQGAPEPADDAEEDAEGEAEGTGEFEDEPDDADADADDAEGDDQGQDDGGGSSAPQLDVRVLPSFRSTGGELGVRVEVIRDGARDEAATQMFATEVERRAEELSQAPPPDAWTPSVSRGEEHAVRALTKVTRAQEADAARRRSAQSGADQRVTRGGVAAAHDCRVVARIGNVAVHDHLRPRVRSEVRAMPTGLRTRGTEIKSVERWWTDGAIFRKNRPGGTIAIDVSGSMSWDWDALRRAIRELPATNVAVYSQSDLARTRSGLICIVARRGRWLDPEPVMEGCQFGDRNGADLEVLTWLSRMPEPRIVLGDFEIHSGSIYDRARAAVASGITCGQFRADLIAEVRASMRQHRIVRCMDVATALQVVRRHGRVNGMRDVWQWNSAGLFGGKNDASALAYLGNYFRY